jgi:hypothetical protein
MLAPGLAPFFAGLEHERRSVSNRSFNQLSRPERLSEEVHCGLHFHGDDRDIVRADVAYPYADQLSPCIFGNRERRNGASLQNSIKENKYARRETDE